MAKRPSATSLGRANDRLTRQLKKRQAEFKSALAERDEAQARQAAMAEILQLINNSSGDFKPVFDALVDKAIALSDAAGGELLTFEGGLATAISLRKARPGLVEFWRTPQPIAATSVGRVRGRPKTIHRADLAEFDAYKKGMPLAVAGVELGGIRSYLQVPLVGERGTIGMFMVFRHEVRLFTDKQIALVEAFAAQAVIALENARLMRETREALERQTAMAEVLQVINEAQGNLTPAFQAIIAKAMALCDATFGALLTYENDHLALAAHGNGPPALVDFWRTPHLVEHGTGTVEVLAIGKTVQIADLAASDQYLKHRQPIPVAGVELGGVRSEILVPLTGAHGPIGLFVLYRQEVRLFTDKQIALVEAFAAQAVIAMENARLITETREALEQQTATTEVLEVINASPGNLEPVLGAMLEKAMHLCEAAFGIFGRFDGKLFEPAVDRGVPAELISATRQIQSPPPNSGLGRIAAGEQVAQLVDLANTDIYRSGFVGATALVDIAGARTAIFVALRKDNDLLGVIVMYRRDVRAFSAKQVALLQNFAAQAVIAMENARLITETREALEQQTATSDILRVISQSPTDVTPVLHAVATAAARLCDGADTVIMLREGDRWFAVAHEGPLASPSIQLRRELTRATAPGRAMLDRSTVHFGDIQALDSVEFEAEREISERLDFRATVVVPMLREDESVGAISLRKSEIGLFPLRQVALLETFATQAVIAIENVRLFTELRESLDQQTATAEILRVINASPGDLTPVFRVILEKAHSVCGADMGSLFVWDGTNVRAAVTIGYDAEIDEILRQSHPGPPSMAGLLSGERFYHQVHEQDRSEEPHTFGPRFLTSSGIRTNLIIPLRKDDAVLGFISANRRDVRPYSDKEIALLESFAAQAVIAMENARLLGELRNRTDDLTESLEYQTATSELLEVISRSTADVQPVLDTLLASACRLCGVQMGGVTVRRDDVLRYVATLGMSAEYDKFLRDTPHRIDRGTAAGRATFDKAIAYIPDVEADPDYEMSQTTTLGKFRSLLGVPLLREGEAIGAITLGRTDSEPFTERQIGLVKTFADQAVIAIENARLLGELTRREEELRVTFDHMGDGVVMFDAGLKLASWNRNFQELLDIPDTFLADRPSLEDYVRLLAGRGELGGGDADQEVERYRERANQQWSIERERPDGRVIEVRNNPVPGGGAVLIYGDITVRKKAEQEIAAARDAAEAALERQTATGEILKVIASSPSDTQPAFEAIAESANRLLAGLTTAVWRFEGKRAHLAAFTSINPEADAALQSLSPLRIADFPELVPVTKGEVAQQADIEAMSPGVHEIARKRGYRSQLLVPLLAQGKAIGFFSVTRASPGSFSEEDVQLLRTFADQATIAIENARLFNDLRDSLERLKAAQANLVQSEKMATLGQLTAGIAHEIKNPLNFVNNFASLSVELLDELKEVAAPAIAELDEDKRAELDETVAMLTSNLQKITEHGKRADGIVKSMLSHSRGGAGDWQPSDINALIEEALNLAYHGARAQDKEFNVTLERDFEKASKPIDVVPQDVTRVFLNLFGNGFYAANKRRLGAREPGFRPTIKVTTRDIGEMVEVKVRDNGTGMTPEVREKLFQAFFTTKPTGEGTGLGLSISYDIVTQQHGGTIEVESEEGKFTEFTVRLPHSRRANTSAGRA